MRRDTGRSARALSTTHNYLFISDLHLSEGINPRTGRSSRNEDFFYDDAFARFLVYHVKLTKDLAADPAFQKPWKLYINGDFLEFLQVTSLPDKAAWLELNPGFEWTPNVERYGLGTSENESIWKLQRIIEGHPLVFQALGWFLAQPDNELVILKGNHDIELFWGGVQHTLLDHISKEYQRWYRKASRGYLPDSPLPLNGHPETLPPTFRQRVSFPGTFAYEPPLFYVEHGNQYDPDNAFTNFVEPILEDKPNLIALPGGSFFVRYIFNQIEHIHPFADNVRPLSRYLNWVVTQSLGDVMGLILRQPREFWRGVTALLQKRGKLASNRLQHKEKPQGDDHAPAPADAKQELGAGQQQLLEDLRHWAQSKAAKRNKRNLTGIVIHFVFRFVAFLLLLLAAREFLTGPWQLAAGLLALWALVSIVRRLLVNRSAAIDHYVDLVGVTRRIRFILNRGYRGQPTGVQFHIFGHDHLAAIEEVTVAKDNMPFRQWYVNTGSWLPTFNDMDRLTRGDIQLAFLRIVPDRPNFEEAVPELLEWQPKENRPVPVRIFDQKSTL